MSLERNPREKAINLEKRMVASIPVFDNEVLVDEIGFSQTEQEIVKIFCSTPMQTRGIAYLRERSPQTIKNQLTSIYRKLGIRDPGRKGSDYKNSAIARLIELGALRYEPVIDVNSCSIVNQDGRQRNISG